MIQMGPERARLGPDTFRQAQMRLDVGRQALIGPDKPRNIIRHKENGPARPK